MSINKDGLMTTLTMAAFFGVVMFWFALVSACDREAKADASNLSCTTVTFDGLEGRRCENDEAVCYTVMNNPGMPDKPLGIDALSCFKK